MKNLGGIKVVDLTTAGSGPSCTKLLAEWGADVVWVEPAAGTSARTVHKFDFYTVDKRDIVINLKAPEGREVMERLLGQADVFVTNYRTQALGRLGLSYEALKAKFPRLVYASITGYGLEGPQADEPGYDPVAFWSKGGMLRDFAEQGSMLVPPISVGDVATGQALAGGIAAALLGRERSGEGQLVTISLLAQAVYLNHDALVEVQYGEEYPHTRRAPRRALLNTYQCSDGKWVALVITANFDKDFVPFMKAMGLERELETHQWRTVDDTMYEGAPELVAILDRAFAKITQQEAMAILKGLNIPSSEVRTTKELLCDPQVLANGYIHQMTATVPPDADTPVIWIPTSPVQFGETPSGLHPVESRGPRLGEHTREILGQLGYSPAQQQALLQKKVCAGPREDETA